MDDLRTWDVIIQHANDAIIVLDAQFVICQWNAAAEQLYGWSFAEVRGQPLGTVLPSRFLDGSQVLQPSLAAILRTDVWSDTVIQPHRHGHELIIESSVRLVRDHSGAPLAYIGINRDITERTHAEAERARLLAQEQAARVAAEQAQQRLAFLSEASVELNSSLDFATTVGGLARLTTRSLADICIIDLFAPTGELRRAASITADPALQPLADALLSEPFNVLTSDQIAEVVQHGRTLHLPMVPQELIDTVSHSSTDRSIIMQLNPTNGIIAPLMVRGRLLGMILLGRLGTSPPFTLAEVTLASELAQRAALAIDNARLYDEVQHAQRTAADTLALLDTLLASIPIGLAYLDSDLRYVHVNHTLADINGRAIADHLGHSIYTVIPSYACRLEPLLRRVLECGQPEVDLELSGSPTEAETKTYISSYYPVRDAAGCVVGIGAVVIDVTQRKQLEAQLLQAQKMESVGRLAGGVAHDFNNLLTAMLGYLDLALESLPLHTPARSDIAEVRAAALRGAALTGQLLAFARKQVIAPQMVDLNALIEAMERLLNRLIGSSIRLHSDLSSLIPPIKVDPGQIEQIVINLAVNARDAMPNGGRLTITTSLEMIDAPAAQSLAPLRPGTYVLLTVSDTGMGMPDQVRQRIFEPFFTTKPPGAGTGLGLATCYGIVKQHGGHIAVSSAIGQGTTFRIHLPVSFENALLLRQLVPHMG